MQCVYVLEGGREKVLEQCESEHGGGERKRRNGKKTVDKNVLLQGKTRMVACDCVVVSQLIVCLCRMNFALVFVIDFLHSPFIIYLIKY